MQVNKVNSRKEFFRVSLTEIHQEIEKLKEGHNFTIKTWTDKAIATEFQESVCIEKDPERKLKWLARQKTQTDRQLKEDSSRVLTPDEVGIEDEEEVT